MCYGDVERVVELAELVAEVAESGEDAEATLVGAGCHNVIGGAILSNNPRSSL